MSCSCGAQCQCKRNIISIIDSSLVKDMENKTTQESQLKTYFSNNRIILVHKELGSKPEYLVFRGSA